MTAAGPRGAGDLSHSWPCRPSAGGSRFMRIPHPAERFVAKCCGRPTAVHGCGGVSDRFHARKRYRRAMAFSCRRCARPR
ncbi:hypothetical protein RGE_32070 [Rubrivivax gelatinosus IL144]|uniref:Uncharacterized protein n=1 Tax=Rubrivivax gelatinosus (strain NBRC 100245 / IL144) TaxID=983917 RepID=I0HU59_RUBGI|nr:hypothetical protein RGE_32070 [Rubrivivax gelatinosus IL144]